METERVIYSKNPLTEVICQLNYPRVLAIDSKLPADFQDAVRSQYPILHIEAIESLHVNLNAVSSQSQTSHFSQKIYNFISSDQKWAIALCSDYVLLRTFAYTQWEYFCERVIKVVEWIDEVYGVESFSRVGLRYVDFIDREQVGLENVPWSELVEDFVLGGSFAFSEFGEEEALEYHANHLLQLNCCKVRLQFFRARKVQNDKVGFVIDGDYFHDATDGELINDPITALSSIRPAPFSIFRKCIKYKLHEAMGPKGIT